ncbi:Peptidoglycan/LPS O-acetylase OafA/YrhL, contains acyltransferase and SGNH-hydrolase domains [Micromonospora pattaloongensis]|uniref:Peptidoglycan/LPS O-acetylase OafA/YrhL, contains acyltransferase and SGNH-hydrolase domains n=1 Tax=Micromonospora pattaloongensis TaxID=405436 RepID=A0A1H3RKT7_9ACTN|nr:acyltransferase [Micromonospora pattaloongensis]SDZ25975.1 Peptidoglycan/LPS O-acetylase OafA/YrhL, contains acyltransferase and SGNH-hydrolase domains [Micromonospora pattaloongensis]
MRNRYLDLLRFLAIIRVVVYHATGWASLSLVFPAMSVMFALAGSLMAASLDRSGPAAVLRRLRRLLPSLWLLAAIFVPAMLLTGLTVNWRLLYWLLPLTDAPTNSWGALALSPIWYLRDYLWFVLLSPLALPLFRRFPVPTLVAPYLLLLVVEFGGLGVHPVVRDIGLYFGAWLLGFAHHDGMLRRMSRRALVGIAAALGAAGAGWIFTHPGPRGYDINDIPLGNALWSIGFVLILLGLAPGRAAWIDRSAAFARAVTVLNQRALTIYLWHMPILLGIFALTAPFGVNRTTWPGLALQLTLLALLVALAVVLFGWVEDLAARRRLAVLPAPRRPATAPVVTREIGTPSGLRPGPAVPAATAPADAVAAGR